MKILCLSLLLMLSAFSYSQTSATSDSTTIKLEQYKEMFSKGLITAAEYEQLKSKLLGLPTTQNNAPNSLTIVRQPNPVGAYKSKLVVGGIMFGAGVGLFIGDFAYIIVTGGKSSFPPTRKTTIIGLSVASGICTLTGAILVGVGQHEKNVYQSKNTSLNLILDSNGAGLALKF